MLLTRWIQPGRPLLIVLQLVASAALAAEPPADAAAFPTAEWSHKTPSDVGLDAERVEQIAQLLGGRGCIVRHGYVVKDWGSQSQRRDWASSAKPVLSTLLLFAIAEGKVADANASVAELGWPLEPKDASMTLAHLANMISGYARPEAPGAAWSYNDFAIQLYQRTLFDKILREDPDQAAAARFAPLQLQDGLAFDSGRRRLKASVRDFARLAWFWRQRGAWNGRQVLPRQLFDDYQRPHVPADLPLSGPDETRDYLQIGTYGGGSNHFSNGGPGIYGFNWWFNAEVPTRAPARTWPDAPPDTFMAIGARGNCAAIVPSLDLVLVAADANWGEFDPGNRAAPMNRLLSLLAEAAEPAARPATSAPPAAVEQSGEPRLWHNVTWTFTGPQASEDAGPNPFRDYRLSVSFVNHLRTVTVPGYFAADGAAAESGASGGNRWRVHFMPDEPGHWSYHASFVRGEDVALVLDPNAGTPEAIDGACGSFAVEASNKESPDARHSGLLRDVRERYFVFAGTNQPYLKGGADSPENFLAYVDFDGTTPTHRYEPHARDAREGDPTWRGGRGKNIIGALNYLADHGVNCLYFLTMNVKGDGKDVWPWIAAEERFRYDTSKLDQWELVFSHMDRLGILLHVVHQEQENDQLLDRGELGPERKLYYRELIARFGHHPALVWNLGEENTNTTAQLKEFARYIQRLDPYDHPIVVHTFPSKYDEVYGPLLGDPRISGASLQVGKMERSTKVTTEWLRRSREAGRPWAAFLDEIGPADTGVKPDSDDPHHNDVRQHSLWGPLMAGGSGAEWLFGYKYPHNDINLEDFRSRERMWDQTRYAIDFFKRHLPVRKMQAAPKLVSDQAHCLAAPGKVYAVYLPQGGTTELEVPEGEFRVSWYDPRSGGSLLEGSITKIQGPGRQPLGMPPREADADWAVLVTRSPAAE